MDELETIFAQNNRDFGTIHQNVSTPAVPTDQVQQIQNLVGSFNIDLGKKGELYDDKRRDKNTKALATLLDRCLTFVKSNQWTIKLFNETVDAAVGIEGVGYCASAIAIMADDFAGNKAVNDELDNSNIGDKPSSLQKQFENDYLIKTN